MRGAFITTHQARPAAFPRPSSQSSSDTSNPKHACPKCGIDDWVTSLALSQHRESGCGNTAKPHHCRYCGSSFSQRTALKTHQNTHTGDRPHSCRRGCAQTFSDPSSRTRHEKEIHNPAYGFKCTRPGCNESTKRKLAFSSHLHTAHNWKQGAKIPESVYTAAKNKCAEDYEASVNEKHKSDTDGDDDELSIENDWNKGKSALKRRRPNSASTSKGHPEPPPAKKQALDPNSARRNAVASIEIQPSHPFTNPHAVHERNNLGDSSTSTASSYVETFSGAYHATGHEFTNGSPSTQPINSVQDYHGAIGRVLSPQLPAPPMRGPMHHEVSSYGVLPGIPRASAATQQTLPCYPSTTGAPWAEHDSSYDCSFTHEVAQTPHGMSSAHMVHEDPSARGMFNPSRSSLPHGVTNSGIHLSTTEHQAEHLSGSPSLDPRLVQSVGPFGDHQALTRSSSEHSNSPHPDSHTAPSMNMYQLGQSYMAYSHHQVPRSVPGGGDQEHSYN